MSVYDNGAKDDLLYELMRFLENHTIYEALQIVTDAIERKEEGY